MSISEFHGFLESELGRPDPEKCLFHVVPVCYEKSVSYGRGAGQGPKAILEASLQLEIFDGKGIPAKRGIFTLPAILCEEEHSKSLTEISESVTDIIKSKKIPVLLGGEHTVSVGAFYGLQKLKQPVGIVQFDAHADLRDTFEGSKFSHACVMHRAVEMELPIFQIGVRSLSPYEVEFRKENSIAYLDAAKIASEGIPETFLPEDFPETIYITFDVDGFDPSVILATGTPEPGGFGWYQALELLEKVIKGRKIIGFDVVELAPLKGLHAYDFTAARLVYNIMGMIDRNCCTVDT